VLLDKCTSEQADGQIAAGDKHGGTAEQMLWQLDVGGQIKITVGLMPPAHVTGSDA
jgi:hypothetical protein